MDDAGFVGGGGEEGTIRGDVAAIFEEGWVIDSRIPITGLPAANAVAEGVHYVAVVSGGDLA